MNRRHFLGAVAASSKLAAAAPPPNIVFLISDDHHWQALGVNGNAKIRTPNLDALAQRGVLFQQGVISVPQCAPSRGVLLSGQEIHQTGLDSNGHTGYTKFQGPTIVEQLKRAGYRTTLIGKWHIKPLPAECGFTDAPLWLRGGGSVYRDPKLRRGLDAQDETVPGHITDLLTDAAIAALKKADGPQFLWLAYNAPHTPWFAAAKYHAEYKGRKAELAPPVHPTSAREFDWETYYAVITHLDEAIGRLVKALPWDNTLFVFLGDNGYLCGTKGLSGKVYPWEESVRVPFFISGGAVKKGGVVSQAPVASIDLPSTFLDYAGVKPATPQFGATLRPLLEGKKFSRDVAFSCWNDPRPEALAVNHAVEPWRIARAAKMKYIVWESGKEALYDIAADPGEEKNLAADPAHAKDLAFLKGRLRARMQATQDRALSWRS